MSWLINREQMSADKILDLVIKYAKSMGYQIVPQQIPLDFQGTVFRTDKILSQQIADVTLPEEFDLIYQMESGVQQFAQQKFSLAMIYFLFDHINK